MTPSMAVACQVGSTRLFLSPMQLVEASYVIACHSPVRRSKINAHVKAADTSAVVQPPSEYVYLDLHLHSLILTLGAGFWLSHW